MSAAEFNQAFWLGIVLLFATLFLTLCIGAIALRAFPSPVLDIHETGVRHSLLRFAVIAVVCGVVALALFALKDRLAIFELFAVESLDGRRVEGSIVRGVVLAGFILGAYIVWENP